MPAAIAPPVVSPIAPAIRVRQFARVDWQQIIALSVVTGTALWMAWGWWRRRRQPPGCATGGCGCGTSDSADKPRITYRARKGQRPEVVVKSK